MKARLPANATGFHLGQVLPAVNRLLAPQGLKVTVVPKGPTGAWFTHLTLVHEHPDLLNRFADAAKLALDADWPEDVNLGPLREALEAFATIPAKKTPKRVSKVATRMAKKRS